MQRHRKKPAWQACRVLAAEIYRSTAHFPSDERFNLVSQMRRAAVSAASNIAEGFARFGPREMAKYAGYSLGSLAELDTLFALAEDQKYFAADELARLEELRSTASKLTYSMFLSFRRAALRSRA